MIADTRKYFEGAWKGNLQEAVKEDLYDNKTESYITQVMEGEEQ